MSDRTKKALRALVGVAVPLLAAALLWAVLAVRRTPPCLFYEATGLYCVGCGTGRSFLFLLRGELGSALRAQPLLPLFPVLFYLVFAAYLAFVFGREVLPLPKLRSRWAGLAAAVFFLVWFVLRNLLACLAPIPYMP